MMDHTVDYLNLLAEADPDAVCALLAFRIPVNSKVAESQDLLASKHPVTGGALIGIVDLLSGMLPEGLLLTVTEQDGLPKFKIVTTNGKLTTRRPEEESGS